MKTSFCPVPKPFRMRATASGCGCFVREPLLEKRWTLQSRAPRSAGERLKRLPWWGTLNASSASRSAESPVSAAAPGARRSGSCRPSSRTRWLRCSRRTTMLEPFGSESSCTNRTASSASTSGLVPPSGSSSSGTGASGSRGRWDRGPQPRSLSARPASAQRASSPRASARSARARPRARHVGVGRRPARRRGRRRRRRSTAARAAGWCPSVARPRRGRATRAASPGDGASR